MTIVSGLERARVALERGVRIPSGALTGHVARSWERCVQRGMDPAREPNNMIVMHGELNARRERNALLRKLAIAEMQLLYSQIAGSNIMIAFGDADGVVLDTISDRQFADSSVGRSIIPGSTWNEADRGTNALGLTLLERESVAIYGREHFFSSHGQLSCMAAPVLDASGDIVGLLDASCCNEARQQHTHALVRMAAAQIENGLIFQQQSDNLIVAFHPRVEYLDTLSAGLIALSRDGRVRSLNRPCQALLAGLKANIGSAFEDLFDAKYTVAMNSILRGGVVRLRDRSGSGVFMVCRRIGNRTRPSVQTGRRPVVAETVPQATDIGFVAEDPRLRQQMAGLDEVVKRRLPVHIFGETGTGKELIAHHIHTLSGRSGEFVAVNCGAVAESLFVAELFGHERGAFTHARTEGAPGLIRAADKGTLFLDEVADIPPSAQTSLLRFLDQMEVRPVGGHAVHKVDVQIVSATNRRLIEAVSKRMFRADLFYRLSTVEIDLPPLRERKDFGAMVQYILGKISPDMAITDAAIDRLRAMPWQGNVRELTTVLQRAVLRAETDYLDEISVLSGDPRTAEVCPDCAGHILKTQRCQQIRDTYDACGANIAEVARILGISRTTIYKHLRIFG